MAIKTTVTKVRATMKLDNGLSPTGAQKTVSLSFPTLNKDTFDASKAWAIAAALNAGCLAKTLCWITKTEESTIEED